MGTGVLGGPGGPTAPFTAARLIHWSLITDY